MKPFAVAFAAILAAASNARGEQLSLERVWSEVSANSKVQKAAEYDAEAADIEKTRAKLHWLPRIYLQAKTFETNDPALSFFGLLSQRSVTANDFNPDNLNSPSARTYNQETLGLDLPLFEGGAKLYQSDQLSHADAARHFASDQTTVQLFAATVKSYGSLLALTDEKKDLTDLETQIERILKRYKIGSRANPVGYSGLLGLRSLDNRIKGLLNERDSKELAVRDEMQAMGLHQLADWQPVEQDLAAFTNQYFDSKTSGTSKNIKSLKESALAGKAGIKVARAQFLPRVGAFAEESFYSGDRASANGYSAGVYLQWNLLAPSDYGLIREATLRAEAAQANAQATSDGEQAAAASLASSIDTLRENLKLLTDSRKLLGEQAQISERLFRDGSINALQLVEALSRRADVQVQIADAELNLLKLAADRAEKVDFKIPGLSER